MQENDKKTTIEPDKIYQVPGKDIMALSELMEALFVSINAWRMCLRNIITSCEAMSYKVLIARIAQTALRVERDLNTESVYDLRRLPYVMAKNEGVANEQPVREV